MHHHHIKQYSITLFAGLLIGFLVAADCFSFASLIYTGPLRQHLLFGISGSLLGSGILLITLACFSSSKITITAAQDIFALIAALIGIALVKNVQKSGIQVDPLPTLLAAIAMMALLLGLCMYLMGVLKLGRLVRYIPFPVIGGFLAGTGWLIFISTLGSLLETSSLLAIGQKIVSGEHYYVWLIPLTFGLTILIARRTIHNPLTFPLVLVLGFLTFYLYLAVSHISLNEALASQWMLGPFPKGTMPYIPILTVADGVQWQLLTQNLGDYFAVMLLGVISLLLNISGFEISSKINMNVDRELKATGIANIFASLLGGHGGYQMLSLSKTNLSLNVHDRWVGILAGIVCLGLIFIGTAPLSYVPTFLFSGLLMYIGLDFLVEWLISIKSKISWVDYFVVLTITIVIIASGLLKGIGLGLMLSLVIFFFRYSRISVIASLLNGKIFHSNVDRNEHDKALLEKLGDNILIINVRGYLFFGNVYDMIEYIRNQFLVESVSNSTHAPKDRFLIFNFSQVSGIEISGTMNLISLIHQAQKMQFEVVFAHLPERIAHEMEHFQRNEHATLTYQQFDDLDHALEWCENKLLTNIASEAYTLEELFKLTYPEIDDPEALLHIAEELNFKKGQLVVHEGAKIRDLFWIAEGELEAIVSFGDKNEKRLKRILAGSIIGEMALYLNLPRTATVVAATDCRMFKFSEEAIEKLNHKNPEIAAAFHKNNAIILAQRLRYATGLIGLIEK